MWKWKNTQSEEWWIKKHEIIYSAIVEKELLHNWLVQREQLKTLKELNTTINELTEILKEFEKHQYFEIHRSKWKIILYNLSLWILFAIWTVLWLMFLSWSTYHFFKDSTALRNVVENQLKIRQFDIQNIKDKVKAEIKKELPKENINQNQNKSQKLNLKPKDSINTNKASSIESATNTSAPEKTVSGSQISTSSTSTTTSYSGSNLSLSGAKKEQ